MVACNLLLIALALQSYDGNASTSVLEGARLLWNLTTTTGHSHFASFDEAAQHRYTFFNCLLGLSFNTLPTYCLTQQSFMRIKQVLIYSFSFSFIMVYLKLNGAFWANCTIFKKENKIN